MLSERDLTVFLHTRGCAVVMSAIACLLAWIAYDEGNIVLLGDPLGIGLPPAREWISSPIMSFIASVGSAAVMGLLMLYVNRAFNVFRSLTSLVAGVFFIMQTSLPSVMTRFYGGDLMGLLMLFCVVLLFSSWSDPNSQKRIFLIFFLIALAAFSDLAYLLYLPIFLLGCVQMRVLDLRTFIAAGLGFITPPWILFGFGIVEPSMLHWPDWVVAWAMFSDSGVIAALVVTGFTLLIGIGFTVANLMKILSYNSRVRAFNGFLTLLLCATGLFSIINFNNFAFYIPLLNCLTAYQIAHFFTYRRHRRSYIPILLLTGVYVGFYFWGLLG